MKRFGSSMRLQQIYQKVLNGLHINHDQANYITSSDCSLEELLKYASLLRNEFCDKSIHRCAIVNARSGACLEDCFFCSQSKHHHTEAPVYPFISLDKLCDEANKAFEAGVTCFGIVTSGTRATPRDIDIIIEFLGKSIASGFPCLGASLGMLSYQDLRRLKNAGLRHYNHNLETSRNFYKEICTTHTWDERYQTLLDAQKAGLEICSGGIFGLGESWNDRIDLAMKLSELGINNVPLNFLSPIAGTPLANAMPIQHNESLRVIALFRFMLPKAIIRICGGRPRTFTANQTDIFKAGASGILTGDYLTTSGNSYDSDRQLIIDTGLEIHSRYS